MRSRVVGALAYFAEDSGTGPLVRSSLTVHPAVNGNPVETLGR